jgi:hypothetical protein
VVCRGSLKVYLKLSPTNTLTGSTVFLRLSSIMEGIHCPERVRRRI